VRDEPEDQRTNHHLLPVGLIANTRQQVGRKVEPQQTICDHDGLGEHRRPPVRRKVDHGWLVVRGEKHIASEVAVHELGCVLLNWAPQLQQSNTTR
jgi:hypothetical protein